MLTVGTQYVRIPASLVSLFQCWKILMFEKNKQMRIWIMHFTSHFKVNCQHFILEILNILRFVFVKKPITANLKLVIPPFRRTASSMFFIYCQICEATMMLSFTADIWKFVFFCTEQHCRHGLYLLQNSLLALTK